MPTVHLTNGDQVEYDRVTIKISGYVKCYDQTENPDYEVQDLGSERFHQRDEVAYPPHRIERVTGEPVAYERPASEAL